MNISDKMEMESNLKNNLADWMIAHGKVLRDHSQSNEYVGVRIVEVYWRGSVWSIMEVDGMVCRIERCPACGPQILSHDCEDIFVNDDETEE